MHQRDFYTQWKTTLDLLATSVYKQYIMKQYTK